MKKVIKKGVGPNKKIFRVKKGKVNDKRKKRIKNIFLDIFALFLFITSYYFYYLSLEKCFDGVDKCTSRLNWIKLKIIQLIISTFIIIILMLSIINKIISKFHLLHFSLAFVIFYFYSHSSYYEDHGGFNLIGLFVTLFIALILFLIAKVIVRIFKIKYKYKVSLIIFLIFSYNTLVNPINCNDWPKGLNNTYIENDKEKYGCQIRFPKKCEYKIIRYLMDFSKLGHITCLNKKKDARKNILKHSKSPHTSQNTVKFGFPLTNIDEGRKDGKDDIILKNYTFGNLMDMDKPMPSNLLKPEYIVDFSKDPFGELIINVNYNKTLSYERKKLENNSNPYSENVIIIYLDSLSRGNSIRQLKKTLNFFEKFMPYKGDTIKNIQKKIFIVFNFLNIILLKEQQLPIILKYFMEIIKMLRILLG